MATTLSYPRPTSVKPHQTPGKKVEFNIPIPWLLQQIVGKTIVGPEGAILKGFTHGEPDSDGKRLPLDGLKGVHVNVTGDRGNQMIQIVGFDNDRKREDKFAILKAKVREHLDGLIDEHGQTQGSYRVKPDERVFTKTVATDALKPKGGERVADAPKGKPFKRDVSKYDFIGDFEATSSKTLRKRECVIPDGWNMPVTKATTEHGLGFGFVHFDYDLQESIAPCPTPTGDDRADRLAKQLYGSRPLPKTKARSAGWCSNQNTKKQFPAKNLNNPHNIVEGDLVKIAEPQRKNKDDSHIASVVKVDGDDESTLIVDFNWIAEGLEGHTPRLVNWKTSRCLRHRPTDDEHRAMEAKRMAYITEMENRDQTEEKPKKTSQSRPIVIHTMTETPNESQDTKSEDAWDHYCLLVQALEVGNTGAFKDMINDRENFGKDFGVWPKNKPILHWAAQLGHCNVIDYLVNDLGFPLNQVGKWGNTELHRAAFHGQSMAANYLNELGSRDDIVNEFGEDPLQSEEAGQNQDDISDDEW